ncbi:MAG TPA: hypothetical protein VMV95_03285 [Bacillota bacterium]|nr:hypothetical protein [Bacillota bacterium]
MSETYKAILEIAVVTDNAEGIVLSLKKEDGKREGFFLKVGETMGDISLVLKPGMNAQVELQKVCDLLNGFEKINGELIPIPDFKQKKITLIKE